MPSNPESVDALCARVEAYLNANPAWVMRGHSGSELDFADLRCLVTALREAQRDLESDVRAVQRHVAAAMWYAYGQGDAVEMHCLVEQYAPRDAARGGGAVTALRDAEREAENALDVAAGTFVATFTATGPEWDAIKRDWSEVKLAYARAIEARVRGEDADPTMDREALVWLHNKRASTTGGERSRRIIAYLIHRLRRHPDTPDRGFDP